MILQIALSIVAVLGLVITLKYLDMALKRAGNRHYSGLTADLPETLPAGSIFIDTEAKKIYSYDSNDAPFLAGDYSYTIEAYQDIALDEAKVTPGSLKSKRVGLNTVVLWGSFAAIVDGYGSIGTLPAEHIPNVAKDVLILADKGTETQEVVNCVIGANGAVNITLEAGRVYTFSFVEYLQNVGS